jgi:hypothetical protein
MTGTPDSRPVVILADDDAITSNRAPFLERSGFTVHVASDGEAALARGSARHGVGSGRANARWDRAAGHARAAQPGHGDPEFVHLAGELGDTARVVVRSVRLDDAAGVVIHGVCLGDLADPAHFAVQRLETGPGRAIRLECGVRTRRAWC